MGKGNCRRHFSDEFKRDAVKLVLDRGMSARKVARELDIHPNLLYSWRRRYLDQGDGAFIGNMIN